MGIWFNHHAISQCARSLIAVCSGLHFRARSFCNKLNSGIALKDKRLVRFDKNLIDIFATVCEEEVPLDWERLPWFSHPFGSGN